MATVQPYAKAKLWIRFVLQGWDALHVNCLLCSPHARILQFGETHYEVALNSYILKCFSKKFSTFDFFQSVKIDVISREIVGWKEFQCHFIKLLAPLLTLSVFNLWKTCVLARCSAQLRLFWHALTPLCVRASHSTVRCTHW